MGINTSTNTVYVVNGGFNDYSVTVIDGKSNKIKTKIKNVGTSPAAIGVNETTNMIYVGMGAFPAVAVIDGSTNTIAGPPIGMVQAPLGIGVLAKRNFIYVSGEMGQLYWVDCKNKTVVNFLNLGGVQVGVDVYANKNNYYVYVANQINRTVSVIGVE